ncbi:hypothetical protein [Listeria newyorkensis]|uniref:hypothetical protein n=1 Tax=Listeria newyorkensis TaxID=1497681 RepID=UPI0010F9F1A8|nr:hypothetical protein [Listeria newyorkensis]
MNNMLNIIIDKKKYTNKQEATKGIPERSNKMVNSDPEFVTIQNFFQLVTTGHTFLPFLLKERGSRKSNNFLSTKIIALDFDNPEKDANLTNKLKQFEFTQKNACFIYFTFSSTETCPRVRIIFILTDTIHSKEDYENIYTELLHEYKIFSPDKCTNNLTLPFFGGLSGTEINFENLLVLDIAKNIEEIAPKRVIVHKITSPQAHRDAPSLNLYTEECQLIRNNDPKALLLLLEKKHGPLYIINKDLDSKITLEEKVDCLSMSLLLGIKDNERNSFIDILHVESNKSASIFNHSNNNRQFYKSFSLNETLNLLQLIKRIGAFKNKSELLNFFEEITKKDMKNAYQKKFITHIDNIYSDVNSELNSTDSQLNKIFSKHRLEPLFQCLIELGYDFLPEKSLCRSGSETAIFASTKVIQKKMRELNFSGANDPKGIRKKINLLAELGLITKISYRDMSDQIRDRTKTLVKEQSHNLNRRVRHNNLLQFNTFDIERINSGIKTYNSRKSKHISYKESVYLEGSFSNKDIYPQEDDTKKTSSNIKIILEILIKKNNGCMLLKDLAVELAIQSNKNPRSSKATERVKCLELQLANDYDVHIDYLNADTKEMILTRFRKNFNSTHHRVAVIYSNQDK